MNSIYGPGSVDAAAAGGVPAMGGRIGGQIRNDDGPKAHEAAQTFGQALKAALAQVNAGQQEADRLAVRLATGEDTDIAAVMIAAERAQLTFQLAVEVRNKVLESYQEIMRMQV
ncbi:MAG TPA: flagellar hook-basal body complex protein FliE [Sphingobacteriaceae bacterium]|nr:flagellar hook-basal body complex protein FliE [Sphingobacteriaceae bacterium]